MRLLVNGREYDVAPEPVESLADTLRDRLHLTGTKVSCGRGECGSCTGLLDALLSEHFPQVRAERMRSLRKA